MDVLKRNRKEAIDNFDLVDIKDPLFYNNNTMQVAFGGNDSVCMSINLFTEIESYQDENLPIQKIIQDIAMTMFVRVLEMRKEGILPSGNIMNYSSVIQSTKFSGKIMVKAVTHYENNFMGKENARCITFMKEIENV